MRREGASLRRVGVALMVASLVMTLLMVANSYVAFGWEWGPRAPQFVIIRSGTLLHAKARGDWMHVPSLPEEPRLRVGVVPWPVWESQVQMTTRRYSIWPAAALSAAVGLVFWLIGRVLGRPQ